MEIFIGFCVEFYNLFNGVYKYVCSKTNYFKYLIKPKNMYRIIFKTFMFKDNFKSQFSFYSNLLDSGSAFHICHLIGPFYGSFCLFLESMSLIRIEQNFQCIPDSRFINNKNNSLYFLSIFNWN